MGEKKIFVEGVTVDDLKSVFMSVCCKSTFTEGEPALKSSLSYDENLIDEFAKYIFLIFLSYLR